METFLKLAAALQKIKDTSGKLDKLALLQAIKGTDIEEAAKQYFSITLDWYRIYNVGEKTLAAAKPKKGGKKLVKENGDIFEEEKSPLIGAWYTSFDNFRTFMENLEKVRVPADQIRAFHDYWPDELRPWVRRALLKDLDIGCSEKTINKVWPKLINYFEVQLADVLEDPAELKFPVILEPKIDGIRAVCRISPMKNKVTFLSRGGQPLYGTEAAGIDAFLLDHFKGRSDDYILDGELFSGNWNDTTRVTSKEKTAEADPELVAKLRFFVFDQLLGIEWDNQKCPRTFEERRRALNFVSMSDKNYGGHIHKVVKTDVHLCHDQMMLSHYYRQYLNDKMEGVMVKDLDGLYTFKRSKAWLKWKPLSTDEFEVVDTFEGKADSKNAGRLGGFVLKVGATTCQVGSGFSDAQREEFWTAPPIGKMVEVEFKEKTPDGLLREPVFVRVRDDKKVNND